MKTNETQAWLKQNYSLVWDFDNLLTIPEPIAHSSPYAVFGLNKVTIDIKLTAARLNKRVRLPLPF